MTTETTEPAEAAEASEPPAPPTTVKPDPEYKKLAARLQRLQEWADDAEEVLTWCLEYSIKIIFLRHGPALETKSIVLTTPTLTEDVSVGKKEKTVDALVRLGKQTRNKAKRRADKVAHGFVRKGQ